MGLSFDQPVECMESISVATLNLLEVIRYLGAGIRFFSAGSSECFGDIGDEPASEETPLHPRSPYAVAKQFAHWSVVNYRESYGMHASCGILFNHESPRRGETFVTRKIAKAAARIKLGKQNKLSLGNLGAKRDWGHAKEYVEAMWLMLQQDEPDDYVIATGETYSVREFLNVAFEHLNLDWRDFVEIDAKYYRPAEVDLLVGDSSKAKAKLGWEPKIKFVDLVKEMVDHELAVETKGS